MNPTNFENLGIPPSYPSTGSQQGPPYPLDGGAYPSLPGGAYPQMHGQAGSPYQGHQGPSSQYPGTSPYTAQPAYPSLYPGGGSSSVGSSHPGTAPSGGMSPYLGGAPLSAPSPYPAGTVSSAPSAYPGGPASLAPAPYPGGSYSTAPPAYPGGVPSSAPPLYPGGGPPSAAPLYPSGNPYMEAMPYPAETSASGASSYPGGAPATTEAPYHQGGPPSPGPPVSPGGPPPTLSSSMPYPGAPPSSMPAGPMPDAGTLYPDPRKGAPLLVQSPSFSSTNQPAYPLSPNPFASTQGNPFSSDHGTASSNQPNQANLGYPSPYTSSAPSPYLQTPLSSFHNDMQAALPTMQAPPVGITSPSSHYDRAPLQLNGCGCGELRAPPVAGPWLRTDGYQPGTRTWKGSALVVCKAHLSQGPVLTLDDYGHTQTCPGVLLASYSDWNFWRFDIQLPMHERERAVRYWVDVVSPPRQLEFCIPGEHQPWHWGFYSCNGFCDVKVEDQANKWQGIEPLWHDVNQRHAAERLHVMVGGGDQLYNDDVFKIPSIKQWLQHPKETRHREPFTPLMAAEVEAYYFHHYATHFSYGVIGHLLGCIPQVMTWDDHDIFDGWGSYPEEFQRGPVFQSMFQLARKYYLLFQQHTTEALAYQHGLFGGPTSSGGYHLQVLLGPTVAVLLPDQRSGRTLKQVLPPESWPVVFERIRQLPPSVQHLVVVTTIPIVYPHIVGSEGIMETMQAASKVDFITNALNSTGLNKVIYSHLDEPELLDDIKDHWTATGHEKERLYVIKELQNIAQQRELRVSFISGDVHLAAVGRSYSNPKRRHFMGDHRFMAQIVSSAIANAPPPDGLVRLLHTVAHAVDLDSVTRTKMVKVFEDYKDKPMLNNVRNWCEIWETRDREGSMLFTLRIEDRMRGGGLREYRTLVPCLRNGASQEEIPQNERPQGLTKLFSSFGKRK